MTSIPNIIPRLIASGVLLAGMAGAFGAWAQSAPAADPAVAVQVANAGKRPIVALYVSAAGRRDWSDDMLGKSSLKPGKSMKLTLKARPVDCKVDFNALLDNGDSLTQVNVDMCATAPSVGF